jgi:hypothetical protein
MILQGPHWFFGLDAVLECVAGLVALLIVIASLRYMRMARDKRYSILGSGFVLIFLAFVSQVITSLFIYHEFSEVAGIDAVIDLNNALFLGHVAYVLLFTGGLIVLCLWALKIKDNMQRALITALALGLAVIGIWNPLIYNATTLALLIFISAKFFLNANEQQTALSWEVLTGFVLITLARLAFILEPLDPSWYVGGHLAQLFGYLILLGVLIQVVRK